MALIGKIRSKGTLVMIVIGGALVLFLLGDLLSSGGGGIFNAPETTVAVINGKEIEQLDFEKRIDNELAITLGNQPQITEQDKQDARDRMWQILLQEYVMFPEYGKIGISVCKEELTDQVVGANPSPVVQNYFTDPQTGRVFEQFANAVGGLEPNKVRQFLQQLSSSEDAGTWFPVERAVRMERLQNKYFNAVKKGLYTTNREAQHEYTAENRKVNFRYVAKNYAEIADSTIEVSDAEIEELYKATSWKANYQQKETMRTIDYVMFDVIPSDADAQSTLDGVTELRTDWEESDNDSTFVFIMADADNPEITWHKPRATPAEQKPWTVDMDSLILGADTGELFGPYLYKAQEWDIGSYRLAKVMDFKTAPDSVDARHILIGFPAPVAQGQAPATPEDSTRIEAKADSAIAVIRSKDNFEDLVKAISDDPGSVGAETPGSYGWITEETNFVKPFKDACFNGEIGDLQKVWTQFGMHIIEVTEKTSPKAKVLVGMVDHDIKPGKETFDKVYKQAIDFSQSKNTQEAFHEPDEEVDIRTAGGIKEGDKDIAGMENPSELVRWAYEAEIGQISQPFELGEKFVVACLQEVWEKGTLGLDIERIKNDVEFEVMKNRKFEIIKQEMSGSASVEELASKLGKEVQNVDEMAFSTFSVPNAGGERELIGKVFTLGAGTMSLPIKGRNGVYVVAMDNYVEPAEAADYSTQKANIDQQNGSRVDFELIQILQDEAEITDNRGKFY